MKGLDAWVTPEDNGVDYKIRGGISAGAVLDSAGVVAISKLPSRIELLGKVRNSARARGRVRSSQHTAAWESAGRGGSRLLVRVVRTCDVQSGMGVR